MRAIIIDDKDAKALLDKLQLTKFTHRNGFREDASDEEKLREIHRWFHYVVCNWLQEQGATVT